LLVYLAPRLLGHDARGMFGIPEPETLDAPPAFRFHHMAQIGEDLRLLLRLHAGTEAWR
jgi:diaminohydroxyphosphoribosylaminopyrimidine deaminase/5-amino-6-(5-phosphoribosylamino)uracil reductase